MADTTTVGFRCDKQTKDDLQRRLVELQSEDEIPLNAKKKRRTARPRRNVD